MIKNQKDISFRLSSQIKNCIHLSVTVHVLVVLLVLARGDVVHPRLVVQIPADGLLYALLELQRRLPSQLLLDLGAVDGIAHVVTGTVSHEGDEVQVRSLGTAQKPVDCLDYHLDKVDILPLVEATDVVRVGHLALVEDQVDGPRVVLHVEPVPHVLSLAVDRKRLAVADIVDEQRYQLLRELVRTVVVGAVRHYRGHTVGVVERTHEMVARCLGGGIGTVGTVLRVLVEEVPAVGQVMLRGRGGCRVGWPDALGVGQFQGSVHLVGGDVVETLPLVFLRKRLPVQLRRLKERERAHDVGPGKGERVLDGAVHMALGGQMDDSVYAVFPEDAADRLEVADVGTHELVVRGLLDVLEVRQVARVGQLVQVHYAVLRVLVHEEAHHMAPDEASAAGYQYVALVVHLHYLLLLRLSRHTFNESVQ